MPERMEGNAWQTAFFPKVVEGFHNYPFLTWLPVWERDDKVTVPRIAFRLYSRPALPVGLALVFYFRVCYFPFLGYFYSIIFSLKKQDFLLFHIGTNYKFR